MYSDSTPTSAPARPRYGQRNDNGDSPAIPSAVSQVRCSSGKVLQVDKALEKCREDSRSYGKTIFADRQFADVILVAADGEVSAHKFILAARSPVMKEAFLNLAEDKEKKGMNDGMDRLKIGEHLKEEVETFLELIYTGESSLLAEHIRAVFLLARKYQVEDMLSLAELGLYSTMNVENVVELFLLSKGEEDVKLVDAVVNFIAKPANKKVIMASEKWKDLKKDHGQLFTDLVETVLAKN